MDRIEAMKACIAVAKLNGFAPAARSLGLSTSAISRQVLELESRLGTQLFHRTTRKVSLTSSGAAFIKRFQRITDDIDALEAEALGASAHPSGEVRLTAPRFFAQRFLGASIRSFLEINPDVHIRLYLMDRVVNIVEEGFDLAVRIGHLEDSSLMARRIGSMRPMLTASPHYLEIHGQPGDAKDLRRHNCIVDMTPRHGNKWPVAGSNGQTSIDVSGNLFVNDGEMVRQMTVEGHGISALPDFIVADDIAAGRLVPLPVEFAREQAGIFLVYPGERHRSAGVQALIDWFAATRVFTARDN